MRNTLSMGAFLLTALLVSGAAADDALKSGPQPGKNATPSPFNPLHANGPDAGQKVCLVWKNGGNPVAMIFAREVSDSLTSLVKKLDEATANNSKAKMGSFVVFLNDEEALPEKLKKLAEQENLKKTVLAVDNGSPTGPKGYNISKDADVTVVLYNKRKVEANHAFKKGELNSKAIDTIVSEIPKILPSK